MITQGDKEDVPSSSSSPLGMEFTSSVVNNFDINVVVNCCYFRFLSWNANSLGAHDRVPQLKFIARCHTPSVISVSETGSVIPSLDGYIKRHSPPDPANKRKGIVLYVREEINFTFTEDCKRLEDIVESKAVEISFDDCTKLIVWAVYIHPSLHRLIIDDILEASKNLRILISGDFNARAKSAGNRHTNSKGTRLDDLLSEDEYNMSILNAGEITFYRYVHNVLRSSIIDLTLISWNIAKHVVNCQNFPVLYSDHVPQLTTLNLTHQRPSSNNIVDVVQLKKFFRHQSAPRNPDEFIQFVNAGLNNCTIRCKQDKKISPWWNAKIRKLMLKRNRILRLPLNDPTRRSKLSIARRNLQKEIRKSKAAQRNEMARNTTSIFRLWKMSRRASRSPKMPNRESIAKANSIANDFQAVSSNWYDKLDDEQKNDYSETSLWRSQFRSLPDDDSFDSKIDAHSLMTSFKSRKKSSTPGYDRVSSKVLECFCYDTWEAFAEVLTFCNRKHYFPTQWRNATLIALRKPTGGFRPISLLSKLGKMYESQILIQLKQHCQLPKWQHCKKGASSQIAVSTLHHQLISDWSEKKWNSLALFDISKAFDSISHPHLLQHLDSLQVPAGLIKLIDSWLTDRTTQTKYNNSLSQQSSKWLGIPQGSPLSLYLFNLYVCDAPIIIGSTLFGYADDLAYKIECIDDMKENTTRVQNCIEKVIKWSQKKLLHLNMSKLELLAVDPIQDFQVQVQYQGIDYEIQTKNCVKYLGIVLESSLYLDTHIKLLVPEVKRRTSILRGLCWNSPPKLYRQLYLSTIRSKIMYCGNLLTYSNNFHKLEVLQNNNLRHILRAYITSPVLTLRAALNVPSLETYAQYLKACFTIHLNKSSVNQVVPNSTIQSPVDEGIHMISNNFDEKNEPNRRKLKKLLRYDMEVDYRQYNGHFRTVYPEYPKFQLFNSQGMTTSAFRLSTNHLNIGAHRNRLKLKGTRNCRICQASIETVNHLLSHYGFRSSHTFLDLLRGSRGTHVDRIRLFKLVRKIRL